MCASPLRFLRAGVPPPKVALLPDTAFFTRAVNVAAGATPADAAAQIELGLEALAPFPLSQLYYGWSWRPGAEQAFVFAAYRRRFTAEQTADWESAEIVMPAFAATLGATVEPATTFILSSPESLTAVHWTTTVAPSLVLSRVLDPDATDDDRARLRSELVAACGGSKHVIDLASPLAPEPARSDGEIVFRSGDFVSRLPTTVLAAADVRDKSELAALRAARKRSVVLWRVAVGCAASLLVLGLGEFALVGGRMWQQVRERQFAAQKPLVDKIESVHGLTAKIEELATKRLRPIEMLMQLVGDDGERKPGDIWFTRVSAEVKQGLNTLFVEGRTSNAAQINAYEAVLRKLPTIEKVDAPLQQVRGDQAQFTLTAVFKADALQTPAAAPKPPSQ
jgi:hypothetical protein